MSARAAAPVDVTVSIVNHRNRERLLETLAALTAAPVPGRTHEIAVLDNASGDGSVEAVAERFPQVRILARAFRAGFGANHNAILATTSGRYVLLLNDDALITPDALGRLCEELDRHPRTGAAAPRIDWPDGRQQPSAWRFPTVAAAALGVLTLGRRGIVQSTGSAVRPVDWATAAVLLLRREALDAVGPFDEGFFMYAEETDLLRRLARAGYRTRYLPAVRSVHHGQASTSAVPERRINEQWRSRHRYWRKHHSRVGGRLAAALTGVQYAVRAAVAAAALRHPPVARRLGVQPIDPLQYRLHARNAWRVRGPGLRELVEDWNARHAAP